MTTPGLTTIQRDLQQIQRELYLISSASVSDKSGILGIRVKHINAKLEKLNDEFKAVAADINLTIDLIVYAMEFVEINSHKFASLLDVSNSGIFKQELVIQLIKLIVQDLDENDMMQTINHIVSASNGKLGLNIHKRQIPRPMLELDKLDTHQIQVYKKDDTNNSARKLRKFIFRH